MTEPDPPLELTPPRTTDIRSGGDNPEASDAEALAARADDFVQDVLLASGEGTDTGRQREAVDTLGVDVQQRAAQRSAMLQAPIRKLASQGEDGGPVASALVSLRASMNELDPRRHRFDRDGLARILSAIPGVGTPVQRYFRKFESAQQALDAIVRDLESGQEILRRDNVTLAGDQEELKQLMGELECQVRLGRLIDERLVAAAEGRGAGDDQRRFIEEEVLFPLRQRLVDLQQQLAVTQQGILALEVVIRNNRELIRGVDRAVNVTVSALNVAVTVAMALANQRLVLDRVERLNASTSDMIAGTARTLRDHGTEIQRRAGSAMLDMKALEQAFADVMDAIDHLSSYRRDALPKLDEQITRLDQLIAGGHAAVDRLERGNAAQGEADDHGQGTNTEQRDR